MRCGDTIFALSSGAPPAAIAIVRISGPRSGAALTLLAGALPPPRRASLRSLTRPGDGLALDRALVLWFPAAGSATGEDLAELHLHGGRAVVAAVSGALAEIEGLRAAEPGEFTRRAFYNGRIDLAEAEGLADLLAAETEVQRRSALTMAQGGLSRRVEAWRSALLGVSAQVEALLDFSDEDDVRGEEPAICAAIAALTGEIGGELATPSAERLRDGFRVVIAGPPNAGKSTLLNALAGRDAAITAPRAGTTRDLIEVPLATAGLPLVLIDTAGLRTAASATERAGIERARRALAEADVVLWLGPAEECPDGAILIHAKADLRRPGLPHGLAVSARLGAGMSELRARLAERIEALLPPPDRTALRQRQRRELSDCAAELDQASTAQDPLILAEHLRLARNCLDRITGRAGTEDMLDALFGAFCIGK